MQAHVRHNVYEVFAQIEPGGPISHIGNLNAPGIELAKTYARRIYDEERWSEMWVVPREQIVVAHPDSSSPFDVPPPPAESSSGDAHDAIGSAPRPSQRKPKPNG